MILFLVHSGYNKIEINASFAAIQTWSNSLPDKSLGTIAASSLRLSFIEIIHDPSDFHFADVLSFCKYKIKYNLLQLSCSYLREVQF